MPARLTVRMGRSGPEILRYEVRHAPHNMTIGGTTFKGGEFVPSAALARATPQQLAMLSGRSRPRSATILSGPGAGLATAPRAIAPARPAKKAGFTGPPAPPGRKKGVVLASPETGSGLSLRQAEHKSELPECRNFIHLARDVDRRLGLKSRVEPGVGVWAPSGQEPGAEPTTVTSLYSGRDFDDFRYAAAIRGYLGNQLAAIAFMADPDGPAAMYSAHIDAPLDEIGDVLSRHGIEYRTLKKSNGGRTEVMVFDPDAGLGEAFQKVAAHFGTGAAVRRGRGELFPPGATSRAKARKAYRGIMRLYEQAHPDRPHWR